MSNKTDKLREQRNDFRKNRRLILDWSPDKGLEDRDKAYGKYYPASDGGEVAFHKGSHLIRDFDDLACHLEERIIAGDLEYVERYLPKFTKIYHQLKTENLLLSTYKDADGNRENMYINDFLQEPYYDDSGLPRWENKDNVYRYIFRIYDEKRREMGLLRNRTARTQYRPVTRQQKPSSKTGKRATTRNRTSATKPSTAAKRVIANIKNIKNPKFNF